MEAVKRRRRSARGVSIIEALVAAVLCSATLFVLGELAVLLTKAMLTTWNKTEGMAAARFAVNRIARDVRHARAFGDIYGTQRITFPSVTNPIYGSNPPIIIAPWKVMTLSESVLVIQQPMFAHLPGNKLDGTPIVLPGTQNKQNNENLNTVVYEVVPDSDRPNEFLIQVAVYPGDTTILPTRTKAMVVPQTILKGLIGPLKSDRSPNVFSYLAKASVNSPFTSIGTPNSSNADSIRGIGIDLEIRKASTADTSTTGNYPQTLALHSEIFCRSNNSMILENTK